MIKGLRKKFYKPFSNIFRSLRWHQYFHLFYISIHSSVGAILTNMFMYIPALIQVCHAWELFESRTVCINDRFTLDVIDIGPVIYLHVKVQFTESYMDFKLLSTR